MTLPLAGVRVLDLTNVIAGPLCSYLLALMGAEVIKVEVPGMGDLARKMGADPALGRQGMGASFLAMNAGKRSMTLNLKSAAGRALFLRLAADADVVVENFRPGAMARLGLSPDALRTANPGLIHCAVSGFGQEGPMAQRPSYDQIIQGLCGLMALTGDQATAPTRAGFVVCDSSTAVVAAFAIAAALFRRQKTGEGEVIDVSMLDCALGTLASWFVSNLFNAGRVPAPMGNHSHTSAPSGTFRCADGPINIVNNEQGQWRALCDAIGRPELKSDPRFAERDGRLARREELEAILEQVLAGASAAEWEERLSAAGVPAARILNIAQAVELPQVRERGLLHEIEVPALNRSITVAGAGFQLGGRPVPVTAPPPTLGEHTEAILREAGCTAAEIAAYRADGVV